MRSGALPGNSGSAAVALPASQLAAETAGARARIWVRVLRCIANSLLAWTDSRAERTPHNVAASKSPLPPILTRVNPRQDALRRSGIATAWRSRLGDNRPP